MARWTVFYAACGAIPCKCTAGTVALVGIVDSAGALLCMLPSDVFKLRVSSLLDTGVVELASDSAEVQLVPWWRTLCDP